MLGYIRNYDTGSDEVPEDDATVEIEYVAAVPASTTIKWESLGSLTLNGAASML